MNVGKDYWRMKFELSKTHVSVKYFVWIFWVLLNGSGTKKVLKELLRALYDYKYLSH